MKGLLQTSQRFFCNLQIKNRRFFKKLSNYEKDLYIHEKASKIDEKKISQFITNTPKQKLAYDIANKATYDSELRDFIDKFNVKHKDRITLMDFSNYTTELGDLKDKPITKDDIELVRQFQKRKVDQKVMQMRNRIKQKSRYERPLMESNTIDNYIQGFEGEDDPDAKLANLQKDQLVFKSKFGAFVDNRQFQTRETYQQGPFKIKDNFNILLLNVRSNTKVTTLQRIQSYKTLLFMGNGNGIISYAKGKGRTAPQSLQKALQVLKKNVIALPRDPRMTMPLHIKKRFQDYTLYLRPLPGFNAHGHPIIALMLTLAGIDHAGFHVAHTQKNVYNVLKVFFKAVTTNTTPQQLAEREGFKVYRHQFIRPLTHVRTHHPSTIKQAKIRQYRNMKIRKQSSIFSDNF